MSDTDVDYGPEDPSEFILADQRRSMANAVSSLDSEPDKAARAVELGEATGDHPALIYGDMENYENQHKAALTASLLNSNKYLRQFIDADPIHAKLFSQDYANLDQLSETLDNLSLPMRILRAPERAAEGAEAVAGGIARGAIEGYKKGAVEGGGIGDWAFLAPGMKDHPFYASLAAVGYSPIEVGMRLISGIGEGVTEAAHQGALAVAKQFGASDQGADQFAREIAAVAQAEVMGMTGRGHIPHVPDEVGAEPSPYKPTGPLKKVQDIVESSRPWLDEAKEPPAGLHPEIDKLKFEQNKADLDNLDEAFKATQSVSNREQVPNILANFIRGRTDADIGISGDAVARLYGDKVPKADDGILGWVPGLAEELETAKATGGDVHVPLADWLAKVDPEVAKELHDEIRVRPGGITKGEKDRIAEQKEGFEVLPKAATPLPEPLPQVRQSTGLEPMFAVGDRKLELKRIAQEKDPHFGTFHDFDLLDESGNPVGSLNLSEQKGGKELYVEMVQGGGTHKMYDPNFFGPALMRDLLRQIKEQFPDAETLTGHRVSGARERADSYMAPSAFPKIKLAEGPKGWGEVDTSVETLRELFSRIGGSSFDVGFNTEAHYAPEFLPKQAELDKAVREELARITPKGATVFTPNALSATNKPGFTRRGFQTQFLDQNPWIVVALESPDAVGVARHEAIHHLRNQGFFTEGEWETLAGAAKMNDWATKYDINNRYAKLPESGKLEEAIAEGYRHWVAGERTFSPRIEGMFQRIKDLFESLKVRLKEILGRDVTWEELFKQVDSGAVGNREGTEPLDARAFRAADEKPDQNLRPAIRNKDGTIKIGRAGQMHMEIESTDPKDTGWVDPQGNFLNREQATDYAEKHFSRGGEYLEDLAENGRPATIEEMDAYIKNQTPEEIANDIYSSVGGNNHAEALKDFDESFSKKDIEDDPRLAKAREIIVNNLNKSSGLESKAADEPETPPSIFDRGSVMTKEAHDLYMELIAKRHAEDLAAAAKRAEKEQRRTQTKEWKANESQVREEVRENIQSRPDVAADLFLGVGEYLGEKLASKPRVREADLTPEQKADLPKHFYSKDGFPADEIGNLFGYPSGSAMLDRLAQYNRMKTESKMSTRQFLDKAIDIETANQMQRRFGDLESSILDEAKDQALSETQLDLLHEETLALGLKAGGQAPMAKGDLRAWVKDKFDTTPLKGISSDAYMAAMGKAGKNAEMALLKENYAEAFREKQRQFIATSMAVEAKKLEKEKAKFDKLVKRYSKRVVTGASPEYTDAVHDILMRLGETNGRRTIQDLAESYKLNGHDSLADFVSHKESQLRDLFVPDWVQDPNFRKPTEELTAQEFREVHDGLKALTFNSRDELKVEKAGEKHDLEVVLGEMVDKLKTLGKPKQYEPGAERTVGERVKSWWWSGINVETMLNRLDRDDPRGPFYQYITHHFTEAANYKEKLIKDFQRKIAGVGKIEDMDRLVENKTFIDPLSGEPLILRRRNVLGILQQAGNKNNLVKLAKGYDLTTSQVLDFLHKNTTKDDWDRAQKIGDIFNEIFDMANTMSHNVSGVGIQRLPLEPLDTPHGTYPGWYNPIKYDPLRPGKSKKLMGPNAIEEEGFFRATTPQGYTKGRTGYIAPVELSLDVVPQRMKQMLHDIAMRPAVLQMSKFFYDNRFERAMTGFYGVHQAKEMIPFLRDIANAPNFKSMTEQMGNEAVEFFRQNTIATLIGLNPSTVMKHGTTAWLNSMNEVGSLNYLREFKNITAETLSGRADWKMAMEKSEELQRRMRNFSELIEGHGSEINIKGSRSGFMSVREMVTNAGATPVSISDLLSAVPTWLAQYKTELANGSDEGMAVSMANRSVRRAHGSSILSNKPAIARTNALGATFSSLYGFFSHMQQKQYELAWKASDMFSGQRSVAKTAPDLIRGLFSYVIAPAIIEELVTPYSNSEHESWGRKAASTMALGVSSSFIGVRDFVRALINVRDPQAGLVGTSMKAGSDLVRDLGKTGAFTKEKAGNLIKHTFALNGVLTGLTNAQEGRAAEYMFNYFNGKEKPKGPWDVATGLRYGTTDKHSRTFENWRKATLGTH